MVCRSFLCRPSTKRHRRCRLGRGARQRHGIHPGNDRAVGGKDRVTDDNSTQVPTWGRARARLRPRLRPGLGLGFMGVTACRPNRWLHLLSSPLSSSASFVIDEALVVALGVVVRVRLRGDLLRRARTNLALLFRRCGRSRGKHARECSRRTLRTGCARHIVSVRRAVAALLHMRHFASFFFAASPAQGVGAQVHGLSASCRREGRRAVRSWDAPRRLSCPAEALLALASTAVLLVRARIMHFSWHLPIYQYARLHGKCCLGWSRGGRGAIINIY